MQFRARYFHTATGDTYWRTVHADDINEAHTLASRYARRGYIVAEVTSKPTLH